MSDEASPRPWRVVDPHYEDAGVEIFDAEGARVCKDLMMADAEIIVYAVNLQARMEEAKAEARRLRPNDIRDPVVIVAPPIFETEALRMYRDNAESFFKDRVMMQRRLSVACQEIDDLRDLVQRMAGALVDFKVDYDLVLMEGHDWKNLRNCAEELLQEARAVIGRNVPRGCMPAVPEEKGSPQ